MFKPEPPSQSCADGRVPVRGESLASLLLSNLKDHFCCWRGASGVRYIFSIFPGEDEALVAGFSGAAVMGVAREGSVLRPVCLLDSADFDAPRGRAVRNDARAAGCSEWHVHFDSTEDELRDLAAHLVDPAQN